MGCVSFVCCVKSVGTTRKALTSQIINKESECSPQPHKMAGDAQKSPLGQLEGFSEFLYLSNNFCEKLNENLFFNKTGEP